MHVDTMGQGDAPPFPVSRARPLAAASTEGDDEVMVMEAEEQLMCVNTINSCRQLTQKIGENMENEVIFSNYQLLNNIYTP